MPDEPLTRADLEREIAHLHRLLEERDKALVLQAREYERRLEDLNHEASRIAEAARQSVPREKYEADERARRAQVLAWIMAAIAAMSLVLTFAIGRGGP